MKRQFHLPKEFQDRIARALGDLGVGLQDSSRLAESVLKLSDFFIANPSSPTPWKEKWAQIAYLVYFLPLNFIRNQAAIYEGERRGFFKDLGQVIDFGSGPGTASLALEKIFHPKRTTLIEKSPQALELARKYFGFENSSATFDSRWMPNPGKTLCVFSYSLTELTQLPSWAMNAEALMILEPSTQDDGRRLQTFRGELLKKSFSAWAPCLHQEDCPLLVHSKKDWCHDRIYFEAPEWFQKMEAALPMKNENLTYSYLLLRKTKPQFPKNQGRLVGDQLVEKGKTRQLICRSQKREFLAWLHRQGEVPELHRGDLFEIPDSAIEVSNEIRIKNY